MVVCPPPPRLVFRSQTPEGVGRGRERARFAAFFRHFTYLPGHGRSGRPRAPEGGERQRVCAVSVNLSGISPDPFPPRCLLTCLIATSSPVFSNRARYTDPWAPV